VAKTFIKFRCKEATGMEGRVLKLVGRNFLLGRGSECAIQIESDICSREHARVRFQNGAWLVQDLESSNGTLLNDQAILIAPLQKGDHIQLGEMGPRLKVIDLGLMEVEEPDEDLQRTRLVRPEMTKLELVETNPKPETARAATPKETPPPAVAPPRTPKPEPAAEPEPAVKTEPTVETPTARAGFPWLAAIGLAFGVGTGLMFWGDGFPYDEVLAPVLLGVRKLIVWQPEWTLPRIGWVLLVVAALYGALVGLALRRPIRRMPLLLALGLLHAAVLYWVER